MGLSRDVASGEGSDLTIESPKMGGGEESEWDTKKYQARLPLLELTGHSS